jgi:hypothetical protein
MTAVALRVEMKISIHVRLTDKRAAAEVVYVDPDQPRHCGIKRERPENIWGLTLPPDDWREEETPRLIAHKAPIPDPEPVKTLARVQE